MSSILNLFFFLLALQVIGVIFLPLTIYLFSGFRGAGVGFARSLGLLIAGYVVWLSTSMGWMRFETATIRTLTVFIFLATAAIFLNPRVWRRLKIHRYYEEWRTAEIVFYVFYFLFFAGMWSLLAIPWGERLPNLSILTAVSQASSFPPEETWFVGESLNYPYYGFYLCEYLLELSGVDPLVGYCLCWPLLPALLAANCFSFLRMLIPRDRAPAIYGTFLVCVLGNLNPIREYFARHNILEIGFFYRMNFTLRDVKTPPLVGSFLTNEVSLQNLTIFLYVLLLGAGFAWLHGIKKACSNGLQGNKSSTIRIFFNRYLLLLTIIFGSMVAANPWCLATAGFLLLLLLLAGAWYTRQALLPVMTMLIVVAGAWGLFLPFYSNIIPPPLDFGLMLRKSNTRLWHLFVHPGFFLIISLLYLFSAGWMLRRQARGRGVRAKLLFALAMVIITGMTGLVALEVLYDSVWFANLFLLGGMVLALIVLYFRLRFPVQASMPVLLAFLGFWLMWFCEVFYIQHVAAREELRYDMMLNFYVIAWVLIGIVTAVCMNKLRVMWLNQNRVKLYPSTALTTFYTLAAALVLISLLHPVIGCFSMGRPFWHANTLNAIHYQQVQGRAAELTGTFSAISWIRDRLPSDAIIVEPTGFYPFRRGWAAMGTGRRTIFAGMERLDYRGYNPVKIDERIDDVYTIYNSTDWEEIERILKKYDADYVVYPTFGPLEEAGNRNLELFRENTQLIYRIEGIFIFQLNF